MNQEFKIPGYIETETSQINTTPFQDGERLDFHMANEKLKSYAEIASRAATLSTEPEAINSKNIFEREPLNHMEMVALNGLKTMKFRQEKAGVMASDIREIKLGSAASKGYDLAA